MMSRGKHRKRGLWASGPLVLLVLLGVLAAGTAGSALAANRYDKSHSNRILPGVRIGGLDVGGMTRPEAIRALQARIKPILARDVVVRAAQKTWRVSLADLGLSADVATPVKEAFGLASTYSWESRVWHRLTNQPVGHSFSVGFQVRPQPVDTLVARVAKAMTRQSRDAGIFLVNGSVVMQHSHPGRTLDAVAGAQMLRRAVAGHRGGIVRLPLQTVQPKITDSTLGKTIVVDKTTNTLHLYDGFHVLRTYPVATAKFGFDTPVGTWEVVNKVENPTWHNPCLGQPGCWAASEPAVIPPGPGNPLGTRALYLNASGIRIHGTPEDSSIGTYASHGCIRMHISDSEALYPLVPIGTPVLIVGAPPWGNSGPAGTPGT